MTSTAITMSPESPNAPFTLATTSVEDLRAGDVINTIGTRVLARSRVATGSPGSPVSCVVEYVNGEIAIRGWDRGARIRVSGRDLVCRHRVVGGICLLPVGHQGGHDPFDAVPGGPHAVAACGGASGSSA